MQEKSMGKFLGKILGTEPKGPGAQMWALSHLWAPTPRFTPSRPPHILQGPSFTVYITTCVIYIDYLYIIIYTICMFDSGPCTTRERSTHMHIPTEVWLLGITAMICYLEPTWKDRLIWLGVVYSYMFLMWI